MRPTFRLLTGKISLEFIFSLMYAKQMAVYLMAKTNIP